MAAKTATKPAAPVPEASKKRPAHEIRFGRLKATIWRQESDKGPWFSVVLTRSYQDEKKDWHSASSFGKDDLLVIAKMVDLAHTWICDELSKGSHRSNGQEDPPAATGDEPIPF